MRLACHVIHYEEASQNCLFDITCLVLCQEVVTETVASASFLLYVYKYIQKSFSFGNQFSFPASRQF